MRKMYDWMMRMAAGRNAPYALALVSFLESSMFPIPPDVMLMPMVLARREKAWWYATIATVASVLGGIAGYFIGYFLLDAIGKPILEFYGLGPKLTQFKQLFQDYGVEILLIKGMTPIPYKLLTISAGWAGMNLAAFIGASIVARAARFFLVAGLLYFFGEPIREFVEKRLTLVTTVFVAALVGGFVVLKYLV
jgi:membrane protein YqaA with SNARE-associated domain